MGASGMAQWLNMPEGKPAKMSSIPEGPMKGESLSLLLWKQTGESKNVSTVYSRKPAESASTREKIRTNTRDCPLTSPYRAQHPRLPFDLYHGRAHAPACRITEHTQN